MDQYDRHHNAPGAEQMWTKLWLNNPTLRSFSHIFLYSFVLMQVSKHWRAVCVCDCLESPNCKPLIRRMFQAATWYICQCYQCLRLRTWQHCHSTETHWHCFCAESTLLRVHENTCMARHGLSRRHGGKQVECYVCSDVWNVFILRDSWPRSNTELTYYCCSFAHAIDFSICNCPVTLPGRGKFRLHLCTYCERVRTLCFSMRDSLRVQQKLPTVTASLMILYQSIRTCMEKTQIRAPGDLLSCRV